MSIKPKTTADTLAKIEQNTDRIADAMELLVDLLEKVTGVSDPGHPGPRSIRVSGGW